MTVTALVTLLMWDALGLEPRDGAILGPLPLRTRMIAGAKLAALLLFASGFSFVFAAASVLYPVLMTDHLHPSGAALLRIIGAHAASVMLASAFAFLMVLAIRGALQAIVSERWFERMSSVVQTALIVLVMSALLLLPVATADVSRDWLRADASKTVRMMPPLWFLGVHATLEGHVVVDTRIVVPPRLRLPPWIRLENDKAAAVYRSYDPLFHELARTAFNALSIAAAVAILGYAWNSRRLRLPTMWPLHRSRLRTALSRWGLRAIAPLPAVRAGFSFTLQVLARSAPHRVAMSAALAFGLSASIVLTHAFWSRAADASGPGTLPPPGVFAAQIAVVAALLGGFRHAARLPAELDANWMMQMAWQGDQRSFLAGSRRAAIVALIVVPLVTFLPVYAALVGWPLAIAHAVVCGLATLAILEALFLGFTHVPFASPYAPLHNPKLLWPMSIAALFVAPFVFAVIEREAFGSWVRTLVLIAALGSIAASVIHARRLQNSSPASNVFEDLPATPTQRLGLRERVMG